MAENAIHLRRPTHLARLGIERPISELGYALCLAEARLALAQVLGDHLGHFYRAAPRGRERVKREEEQQAGNQACGEGQPGKQRVGTIDNRVLVRAEMDFPDPAGYLDWQLGSEKRRRIAGRKRRWCGPQEIVAVK